MKKLLSGLFLIFLLTLLNEKSFCQIPNASFENWSGGDPEEWETSNEDAAGSVTQSSNAHTGSSAVALNVINMGGGIYMGGALILDGNSDDELIPVSSPPDAIHGWYIANFISGDRVQVSSGVVKDTVGSGVALSYITESSSVYKEFIINYTYPLLKEGDSVSMTFNLVGGSKYFAHLGSNIIIDDLFFGAANNTTGTGEVIQEGNISLEQNQPNPATDKTNIIYSLTTASPVTLEIFDLLGRKIKTVVNTYQTPGRYKAILDVSDLSAGNYLYQLTAFGAVRTDRLVVIK